MYKYMGSRCSGKEDLENCRSITVVIKLFSTPEYYRLLLPFGRLSVSAGWHWRLDRAWQN